MTFLLEAKNPTFHPRRDAANLSGILGKAASRMRMGIYGNGTSPAMEEDIGTSRIRKVVDISMSILMVQSGARANNRRENRHCLSEELLQATTGGGVGIAGDCYRRAPERRCKP